MSAKLSEALTTGGGSVPFFSGIAGGFRALLSKPEEAIQLREMADAGMPKAELARTFQISRETVYAYLKGS